MAELISLREIAETMEVSSDECVSYLDPDTGEIITVTEESDNWRNVGAGEAIRHQQT